jgi:hypothetical protein
MRQTDLVVDVLNGYDQKVGTMHWRSMGILVRKLKHLHKEHADGNAASRLVNGSDELRLRRTETVESDARHACRYEMQRAERSWIR